MRAALMCAGLSAAALMSACSEKPQEITTRKADAAAYTGAEPAYHAPGWKPGDAASWEAELHKRTANGQNEYTRAP